MALQKIQVPRKIRPEDYPEDSKEGFAVFADQYNQFIDDVYRAISTPDEETITYTINVGAGGVLINPAQIKTTLVGKIRGLIVINSQNVNSPSTYPTSQPNLAWTISSNGLISILNVSGLQDNSQYILTIKLFN